MRLVRSFPRPSSLATSTRSSSRSPNGGSRRSCIGRTGSVPRRTRASSKHPRWRSRSPRDQRRAVGVSTPTSLEVVQTPRLLCERVQEEHLGVLVQMLQDPRVGRWIWPRRRPPTERELHDSLIDKIEHWDRFGFGMWLLRDRASGEAVGRGGLQWTYVAELHEVEAGWAIVPERWGEGLATELAHAAVETGF